MNSGMRSFLVLCVCLFLATAVRAQEVIGITSNQQLLSIGQQTFFLKDLEQRYSDSTIQTATGFEPVGKNIPVFPKSTINNWLRFRVANQTDDHTLYMTAQAPGLPSLMVYKTQGARLVPIFKGGNMYPYGDRPEDAVDFVVDLKLRPGDTATYYLHVVSNHPLVLPLIIGSRVSTDRFSDTNVFIIGAYFGILLVIFFYNLFIYFSVKDRNYLLYIIYVFFLGLAQFSSSGFAFKYLWPDVPGLNRYMVVISSSVVCMVAIVFAMYFLQMRTYARRLMPVNWYFLISYSIAILANLAGINKISYNILDINGLFMAIYVVSASAYIAWKGFKGAIYYLLAWFIFMVGLIFYVLKNYGILPSNIFSNYALYIGSSVEAILLSIALADKINVLTREKEASQAKALEASRENERLVREQNVILEAKVHERTKELEKSNDDLNGALDHLKATQSQLVESEKMASLGVLTAGIAHEINNPINFVKSNIKPLQLDIRDLWEIIGQYENLDLKGDLEDQIAEIDAYKREIDIPYIKTEIGTLLQGIEDGATRTAEIVKGLRTFSRLDETELKKVSLHEGLDSTLVLLKSTTPGNIQVVRHYEAIPNVECFPGKLNQVFMNIMSNALYAMDKKHSGQTEYLTVSTAMYDAEQVQVRIADTGTGMPDEVREKIFDPFFTTKEIGEGTGLGLSIVFSIIEKHKGRIVVHSTLGKGTEFQIILPIVHPVN